VSHKSRSNRGSLFRISLEAALIVTWIDRTHHRRRRQHELRKLIPKFEALEFALVQPKNGNPGCHQTFSSRVFPTHLCLSHTSNAKLAAGSKR